MRVLAERVPRRSEETVELTAGATGLDLLRTLGLAPDAHLLVSEEVPIPLDAPLTDGQRVRVIGVVSGGWD